MSEVPLYGGYLSKCVGGEVGPFKLCGLGGVRTGSWMDPPQGENDPRMGPICIVINVARDGRRATSRVTVGGGEADPPYGECTISYRNTYNL